MPELPEVETIRRQLCAAGVEGRTVEKVQIEWPRTVEPLTLSAFCKQIKGCQFAQIDRHGKWLIFRLDGKENLLVHLRMTGGFYLTKGALEKGKHDRVILQLSGGLNLHFRDPRKFGRWRLAASVEGLGPDALTVTKKEFFRALPALSDANGGIERGKRNKVLKALLLDQSFVAGVGNIYADEALFEARLDPRRKSGSLSDAEKLALYKAVTKVIKAGVRNKGTSLGDGQGNYVDLNGEAGGHREKVKVYGRAGQPCTVCGQLLHKTQITQRTTVYCQHCQK